MRHDSFTLKDGPFKGRTVFTLTFDSLADCAATMETYRDKLNSVNNSWADQSAQTVDDFIADLKAEGTTRNAAMIRKAGTGISLPPFRLHGEAPTIDVGPGVPIIPAVLAGQPEHSLTIANVRDTTTPIRVYFDRTSSASLSAQKVEEVGATVAAFVEHAQASRPVELWVMANLDAGTFHPNGDGDRAYGGKNAASIRLKLSSHPSQAELGLYCSALGLIRRGFYGLGHIFHEFHGVWPFEVYNVAEAEKASRYCVQDVITENDIFIGTLHAGSPIVTDPKRWVEDALTKAFGNVQE